MDELCGNAPSPWPFKIEFSAGGLVDGDDRDFFCFFWGFVEEPEGLFGNKVV